MLGAPFSFELLSADKPVVLVPVRINGKGPYRFVLDTGAVICAISSNLGKALGVKATSSRELSSIPQGEQVKIPALLGKANLEIGGTIIPDVQVVMADLTALSNIAGRELNGIIGYNALKNFKVTIDYPHSLLHLDQEPQRS